MEALGLLALYFLPALAAIADNKRDKGPIIVINIFLGWTFLGWVVALAWAAKRDR